MAWKIKIDKNAEKELSKLDRQVSIKILKFLRDRLSKLDNPRLLGDTLVANTLNAYIITRWKIMLKGKFFWIRSLGSSSLAEAIYSFIAIILMEIFSIPLTNILKVILLSYSIKLLYSLFFAFPVTSLVKFLKNYSGVDIYDFPKQLTPEAYLAMDNNKSY